MKQNGRMYNEMVISSYQQERNKRKEENMINEMIIEESQYEVDDEEQSFSVPKMFGMKLFTFDSDEI